ncbi:MAG: T9SS C-terminal target domain-containing protein [Saprospirales bacterium]|nr:MAG: T9SS C-terminal target domain-containing protein [Saprospirales bacterium]
MKKILVIILFSAYCGSLTSQVHFSKVWDPDGLDDYSWVKHSLLDNDTLVYFAENVCNFIDFDNYNYCTTIGRMDKDGNIINEVTYNDLVLNIQYNPVTIIGDKIYIVSNDGRWGEDPKLYILVLNKNSLELISRHDYTLNLDVDFYLESSIVKYKDYLVVSCLTQLDPNNGWEDFLLWINKESMELQHVQENEYPFEAEGVNPRFLYAGEDGLLTVFFNVHRIEYSEDFPNVLNSPKGFLKYNIDGEQVFIYLDTLDSSSNLLYLFGFMMKNGQMVYRQDYNHQGFEIQNGADFEVISINDEGKFNWRFNQVGFSPYGKKQLIRMTETAEGDILGCGRLNWHFNYPNLHEFNYFTDTIPHKPDSLERYNAPYLIKLDGSTGEMLWEYALIEFNEFGFTGPSSCQLVHELSDGSIMGRGIYDVKDEHGNFTGQNKSWAFRLNGDPCPSEQPECGFEVYLTDTRDLGLIDLNKERRFLLYPNPTSGSVFMKDALDETTLLIINVFDSSGRLLDRVSQYSTEPLNLNESYSGMLYLEILNERAELIQTDVLIKH